MQIKPLKMKGAFEIKLKPFGDERGFFMRTFDKETFKEWGLDREWVQENHAASKNKHTLRGLHFQLPPYAETKILRCTRGAVLDVFVDLRDGSETFGQWDSVKLSAEEKNMVVVPQGFAHGYMTLEDNSEVTYKVDNVYHPASERAIRWNDPEIGIEWGVKEPILSEKDQNAPSLQEFLEENNAIKV